jgi:hypothetical protein
VLQSLGNSNFVIKVSHIFYLMMSETTYFSSCVLPFQNLYVIGIFSLMSYSTDVFHAFTETSGCVGSPTSLTAVMTKRPLGNLFGPRPCLTCDVDEVPTRAYSTFLSSSSFTSPSCSVFIISSSSFSPPSCSTFTTSSSSSSWFKFRYTLGL